MAHRDPQPRRISDRQAPPSTARRTTLLVIGLAVSLTALAWMWSARASEGPPTRQWFFDLNTQQLFPGPIAALPPIEAPSGPFEEAPAGVKAAVVSTPGGRDRRIVYLQTLSTEAQALLRGLDAGQELKAAQERLLMAGTLVARPPAGPQERISWHAIGTPEGRLIIGELEAALAGGAAVTDLP